MTRPIEESDYEAEIWSTEKLAEFSMALWSSFWLASGLVPAFHASGLCDWHSKSSAGFNTCSGAGCWSRCQLIGGMREFDIEPHIIYWSGFKSNLFSSLVLRLNFSWPGLAGLNKNISTNYLYCKRKWIWITSHTTYYSIRHAYRELTFQFDLIPREKTTICMTKL